MSNPVPSISALRYTLKLARDRYRRSHTYDNALAVQKAVTALKNWFKNDRTIYLVVDNKTPVPVGVDYVPPIHWRVIGGGDILNGKAYI